jgi:MFS family permease
MKHQIFQRLYIVPFVNRLLHWMIVGIMTSIMTLMILSRGVQMENLGLLVASFSIITVILEFPSGVLSDLLGRKRIYIISLAFSLAARLALLAAQGFFPIAMAFALYGVSRAFSSGSIEALYTDQWIREKGKNELHRLMSVMGIGETLGLACGALAGGFLPQIWDIYFPAMNRYDGNIIVQIVLILILLIFTSLTSKEKELQEKTSTAFYRYVAQTLEFAWKNRILRTIILGSCLWGIAFSAIEVFWQPRLKAILGSETQAWIFGLVNSGYFVASLLGVIAFEAIAVRKKVNSFTAIFLAKILCGLLIILLATRNKVSGFAFVYLTMFLFNGAGNIPEGTAFNSEASEERRSSLLSVSSLAMQLGAVLGSIMFGFLVSSLSIPGIWILAGIVLCLSSFLYLGLIRRKT